MAVTRDPSAAGVVNRLDGLLGETGRREHRFAWLTDRRSGDWLAVDAYYPRSRVVLMCSPDPELLELCEALVPAHGLVLLAFDPEELDGAGADVGSRLQARLSAQGWPERMVPVTGTDPPARTPIGSGPPDAEWIAEWKRAPARVRHQPGDPFTGVILVIIAVLEIAVGGGVIGLGSGEYVLGFGCVLDACARVLGTIAASHNNRPDAAWTIVLFGSPALWSRDDFAGEVAPVAQVTAILAGVAVTLGLIMVIV